MVAKSFKDKIQAWRMAGGFELGLMTSHDVPDHFVQLPRYIWPGDTENGEFIKHHAFILPPKENRENKVRSGLSYKRFISESVWENETASRVWQDYLHSFEWIRDLRALVSDQLGSEAIAAIRVQIRDMIRSWIEAYPKWDEEFWAPSITGKRLAEWLGHYTFYEPCLDEEFRSAFMQSLTKQARYLGRTVSKLSIRDLNGVEGLQAVHGLVVSGLCLPQHESLFVQGLERLEKQLKLEILSDGGHKSRSPEILLQSLMICLDIRRFLIASDYPVPKHFQETLAKMGDALRSQIYPDRKMAIFHGSHEGQIDLLTAVFRDLNTRTRTKNTLGASGYERITLGRSVLFCDVGTAPQNPYDNKAHAAGLPFEFIYGKERVFVNAGTHFHDQDWKEALRATAAHNALEVDGQDCCDIQANGHFKRKIQKTTVNKEVTEEAGLIELSHDGYVALNGITHRRRLYLGDHGHDLRGEEILSKPFDPDQPHEITIRFHLHPRVLVSLIQDGTEALLRLSGGAGWRFQVAGACLSLDNSVYCGDFGSWNRRPRKTKQLVLKAWMPEKQLSLSWALKREIGS